MKPEGFYNRPWSGQAGAGVRYTTYTGSSFDLYPRILQKVRTTIYNGDPAGYVTTWAVPGAKANLTFVTVKDSGHMVPQYQPERAFAMFSRWIDGGVY